MSSVFLSNQPSAIVSFRNFGWDFVFAFVFAHTKQIAFSFLRFLSSLLLPEESFSMDPTNFFVIYPSYLDSSKTIKQGRRIGAEKAVDTPTVQDISEALASMSIRHVSQPHKGYSRDATTLWDNPGRVRVDPSVLEGDLYTKRSLMVELASIVRELPSRTRRLEVTAAVARAREAKRLEAQEKKKQLARQQHKQKSSQASSRSNKKKGKKKR